MILKGEGLSVQDLAQIAHHPDVRVEVSAGAREAMKASRSYIENRIQRGDVMYGVNTGFGAFSSVRISDAEIETLQRNLIRSHSAGIGEPFTREQTRAMMGLRANTLARGHSGVRAEVVDKILEFLNKNIIPVIPSQGSVGASGDLAPLSHLALALIGEGEIWGDDGRPQSAAKVLSAKGVAPLVLQAKEGLSLINGCQVMTGVGMLAALRAQRLLLMADIAGALSLEGLRGSRLAFDPLIAATRPHPGEAMTARNLLKILGSQSAISESHAGCGRVQDSYSLRCMPAVHGAAKDALRQVWKTLEVEANSSTDNPLVFAAEDKVLSCGNFHGEPVAMQMDFAGIALSVVASISECRISKLINPAFSELPAFLAPNGGLNSGHMIVQVAAAALVSENKVLSHPACVDSIPTSTDKEDHVSMGTIAARKFEKILSNAEQVLTMELLSGAQAIDLLAPLKPAAGVAAAYDLIRTRVPFAKEDRIFAHDVQTLYREFVAGNRLVDVVQKTVGGLEW
ncbi:MAG: histidine ammonia-lyase [Bdellovibrionaceae bacterium]|nr:histidine ammonia-lyase [Pseudobdellovibrionaceae bacterium]MBX3032319.1 histidine ammonia-lyase [Pseudobdellovibrionaceae bacterium]